MLKCSLLYMQSSIGRKINNKFSILFILIFISYHQLIAQNNNNKEMLNEKVKIEIWSDIVCPFCFIGKKKMEQAIAKLKAQDLVEIEWHSFQLDPQFPMDSSMPSMPYLSEYKGYPMNQVNQMCDNLTEQGKLYSIDFNFDKAMTFNTYHAHRLIQWSKTKGLSNELKEAFMEAYFTNGIDLSNTKFLIEVVKNIGLNVDEAQKVLGSDAFSSEVNQDIYQARQLGIRGVPFFLINNKETISGAQQDKVFENVIESALKKIKPIENIEEGKSCLPNGDCK